MVDTLPLWKRRAWRLNEQGLVDDALAALIADLLQHDPELARSGEPSIRFAWLHIRDPPAMRQFLLHFEPLGTFSGVDHA